MKTLNINVQERKSHFPKRAGSFIAAASLVFLAGCGENSEESAGSNAENGTTELVVAHHLPPGAPSEQSLEWFADEISDRSNGRLELEITDSETICPANEIANCTNDGRVDVGVAITDYTPQLFPGITIMGIPFLTQDAQAAMNALYVANDEHSGAQEIWEDSNLQMIGHWSAGRMVLGSHNPVNDLSDISGMRWRISGPYLQEAIDQADASIVALTAPETYEGIQRGMADGVGISLDGPVNFKLTELLQEWADPGIGHYNAFGMWMNKDVYESLDSDLQSVVDEVTSDFNSGEAMRAFNEVAAEQCDAFLNSEGIEGLGSWSEESVAEWKDLVLDDLIDQWVNDATEYGLEDAQGYADLYSDLLEDYDTDLPDATIECAARE